MYALLLIINKFIFSGSPEILVNSSELFWTAVRLLKTFSYMEFLEKAVVRAV